MGEAHPDPAIVRAGHHEHGLALHRDTIGQGPVAQVGHQHLVVTNRRHKGLAIGDGPTLQVGHLVHRQLLLALAIIRQNFSHSLARIPQIQHRQAVFAKQAGNVITAVRGDQCVVR